MDELVSSRGERPQSFSGSTNSPANSYAATTWKLCNELLIDIPDTLAEPAIPPPVALPLHFVSSQATELRTFISNLESASGWWRFAL
jgi:hypothetical protein